MGIFSGRSLVSAGLGAAAGGLTGGWAGAGIGALGGLMTANDAQSQYSYQKKLNKSQMNWQEYMSNTAHQREIADLRAAGLNPILSATGGSGASTPSGAVGEATGPNSSKVMDAIARAQEKRAQDQRDKEIDISRDSQESQAALNEKIGETQRAQQDYYSNLAAGQLLSNMNAARREEWIKDHPGLFQAQMYGEALQPYINSALNLVKTGANVYGASKVGSSANKMGKTLGQIRHDQYERGYWRGYVEGPLNRI